MQGKRKGWLAWFRNPLASNVVHPAGLMIGPSIKSTFVIYQDAGMLVDSHVAAIDMLNAAVKAIDEHKVDVAYQQIKAAIDTLHVGLTDDEDSEIQLIKHPNDHS